MNKPTKDDYKKALDLAAYDSTSRRLMQQLIEDHFGMIQHMKSTSLWEVFEYEDKLGKAVTEPMKILVFENEKLKKEVNKLRKKLGMVEKYKEADDEED